ncbi:L-aspartate oxidase [Metabacillus fastidiosus]|uniref:L-aspartate oxidase n=1 Tax=Metabacillus fastidiosus TaxID=1458 RepID=UPI003D28DDBE
MLQSDVIIIGSGLAALSAAYHLCHQKKVTIITKSSWKESNSMLAQGGIAAAISEKDSWQSHYSDTLVAGCNHNNDEAVEKLVQNGITEILEWFHKGLQLDCDEEGNLCLGKEGAHEHHRIVHAGGDATGREITKFIYNLIKQSVTIVENEMAVQLLINNGSCYGVITKKETGEIKKYIAAKTIIATGGCGAVYGHTSNAAVITGDGIAMAYRAGAEIADMEFIQFHPTMLYLDGACVGLVSEAVRGEGAYLVNQFDERIMQNVHPQEDLAPRDVVSRTIFYEMKKGNQVFLNISPIKQFETRFPSITALCREHHFDINSGKIPVAPGMHFLMGGIQTNDVGETSIKNLFAVGEAACTGVHGANRLASNSLLEGLVFGRRLAFHLVNTPFEIPFHHDETDLENISEITFVLPTKEEIQSIMSRFVGITRTEEELAHAAKWLENYKDSSSFWQFNVKNFTISEIEIINMMTVGWLITTSAMMRSESRGGHFRVDYPLCDDSSWLKRQLVRIKEEMQVGV